MDGGRTLVVIAQLEVVDRLGGIAQECEAGVRRQCGQQRLSEVGPGADHVLYLVDHHVFEVFTVRPFALADQSGGSLDACVEPHPGQILVASLAHDPGGQGVDGSDGDRRHVACSEACIHGVNRRVREAQDDQTVQSDRPARRGRGSPPGPRPPRVFPAPGPAMTICRRSGSIVAAVAWASSRTHSVTAWSRGTRTH